MKQTARILIAIQASQSPPSGVRNLSAQITSARAKAVASDPSWLSFQSWLDKNLPFILPGTYQGSNLTPGTAYAVGYQCALALNDAARTDSYGRKAAAILASACRDLQYRATTRQFLITSDGTQTTFTLPDDPIPASFHLYWAASNTVMLGQASSPVASKLSGRTVTITSPRPAGQALFVEYVRPDYSQTSSGGGGFDSIKIDSGYTSRFLRHAAYMLDWCAGHPAIEALRAEATSLLTQWSNWLRDNGYTRNIIASNYACGHYALRTAAAIALGDAGLLSDVLSYHSTIVVPQLSGPSPSLQGGFWAEGWNYGNGASSSIYDSTLALMQAGGAIDGAAEMSFFADMRTQLIESQPGPGLILDLGDGYAFPARFPSGSLPARVSLPSTYALGDWDSLLFPPTTSTMPAPTGYNFASGTGVLCARTGTVWSSILAGNILGCNHQQYAAGHVEYYRNGDCLLANELTVSQVQAPSQKSQRSNVLVCDDGYVSGGTTAQLQTYRFNQGVWYGTPGVKVLANDNTPAFVHLAADLTASYSSSSKPGDGGSLSQWVRHLAFLKPSGVLVVVDQYALKASYCTAWPRWSFIAAPALAGQQFMVIVGGSVLSGQILSSDALTLTAEAPGTATKLPRITASTGKQSGTIISVFQSGPVPTAFDPAVLIDANTVQVIGLVLKFGVDGSMVESSAVATTSAATVEAVT